MEIVSTSADPPKPVEQKENKQPDSDPHPPSSPPPKKEDPPKKASRWKNRVKKFALVWVPNKSSRANGESDESSSITGETEDELIESINSSINDLKKQAEGLEKHTSDSIRYHLETLEGYLISLEAVDDEKEKKERLYHLEKDLIKLKLAVPSKEEARAEKKLSLDKLKFTTIEEERSRLNELLKDRMPKLHRNPIFDTSMELKEFVARFDKLDNDHVKLCLLCFSVFPVGAVIKKRLMVQWWVAEGYASTEEVADENFRLLIKKGFIEPVNDNRSPTVGSCRVHPFNRLALVALASRASFFNFVEGGEPTQDFSGCYQACLMGEGLISYDEFTKRNEKGKESKKKREGGNAEEVIKALTGELEKLHLLMNVDEHILEFKHEWFGRMRNVNVLNLGRWKVDATHHIEVEDKEFLEKGLKKMRCLKLLSLQGISNIISLPDSILSVANLNVLDLRACYNLETIPENMGRYLERLTHLDMSECYLLEHMPKSLKMLKKLKVLKGFFVGKRERTQCMLGDLVELKQLEKLCLYTNSMEFPTNEDVKDLENLKSLSKLTITWGVGELSRDDDSNNQESSSNEEAEAKTEVDKPTSQANSKKQELSTEEAEADKLPTSLKNSKKQESSSNEGAEAEAEAEAGKLPTSEKNLKKEESSSNEEAEATAKAEAGKFLAGKKISKKQESSNEEAKTKEMAGKLPSSLKKLDLKCFPMSKTPDWLKLENLKDTKLEKLYIRGGKFSDVGQYGGVDETWEVKVLRLKYLSEIEMEWRRLRELFPKLEYLEQVECPKLTFFPCDAKGVWIN